MMPTNFFLRCAGAAIAAGAILASGGARADETNPGNQAGAESCIQIAQIDHTKILDDQNILFHLKNRKIYKNQLPHRCAGLKSADTFRYRTSQSQLCNVDVITVLNRVGGDFMPGPTCGLGMFVPYTPPPKENAAPPAPAQQPEVDPEED